MRSIYTVVAIIILLVGCDGLSSPRDYDDCILKNMRGVESDLGAAHVRDSCREKFPEGAQHQHKIRELNIIERMNLTGRAGLRYGNRYSGSLYNGNESVTVTSVRIQVIATHGEEQLSRVYQTDVRVPPLSTSPFGFDILVGQEGSEYSWAIVGARGYVD